MVAYFVKTSPCLIGMEALRECVLLRERATKSRAVFIGTFYYLRALNNR